MTDEIEQSFHDTFAFHQQRTGLVAAAESLPWSRPDADPLADIHRFMNRRRDEYTTFRNIFEPDIEKCTRVLEHTGYQVWFTCEVDGTEYRLAARKS